MNELSHEYKAKIEGILYPKVLLMIEGKMFKQERQYRTEELLKQPMLARSEKISRIDMHKQRLITINIISELIKDFAQENNLEIEMVKNYLLKILEETIKEENRAIDEYVEAKEIIETEIR